MTPSTAYGKDCLSITLGDGDEEKFMDNVPGCVSPPYKQRDSPPSVLLHFVKKVDKNRL